MNKNKKIVLGLIAGAFLFAFLAIFMGFTTGVTWKYYEGGQLFDFYNVKFFDLIFNKQIIEGVHVLDFLDGKTNAVLVLMFVITLLSILATAGLFTLNIMNKASAKLNKISMITLIAVFGLIFILMICSKGVCGIADEHTWGEAETQIKIVNTLGAGPICWSIFSLISCGAMVGSLVLSNKGTKPAAAPVATPAQ